MKTREGKGMEGDWSEVKGSEVKGRGGKGSEVEGREEKGMEGKGKGGKENYISPFGVPVGLQNPCSKYEDEQLTILT